MSEIEDIASVHLGKAGDGSVVKPYVTPDVVDPGLLVGIPRYLNRTMYGIKEDDLPFFGYDAWNCYEFSTLTDNGFPVSGLIRLVYPSDSANIVESKSLKLDLNSFNMMRLGRTSEEASEYAMELMYKNLSDILKTEDVHIAFFNSEGSRTNQPLDDYYDQLESMLDISSIEFNHYNESPDILKVVDKYDILTYNYSSSVLRSNCRVTNQPDWGDVFISYVGSKTVTPESLLQYIVSMRKENHFHEEICECIYKRLLDLLNPEELMVTCLYTRRGGIDINPIRSKTVPYMTKNAQNAISAYTINKKTLRQ